MDKDLLQTTKEHLRKFKMLIKTNRSRVHCQQLFFYFCFRLCTIFTWSVCAVLNNKVSNECVSCDIVVLAQEGSLFCNRACLSFQAFMLHDFKCQSEKAVT